MKANSFRLSPLEIGGGKVVGLPGASGREPSPRGYGRRFRPAEAAGSTGCSDPHHDPAFPAGVAFLAAGEILRRRPTRRYATPLPRQPALEAADPFFHPRSHIAFRPAGHLRLWIMERSIFPFRGDGRCGAQTAGGAAVRLVFLRFVPAGFAARRRRARRGWKAATLRFRNIPSPLLVPITLGGVLLASLPPARRWAFAQARRFYQAEERLLPVDPAEWHTYAIEWRASSAGFFVDGAEMLRSAHPPLPPLGLVLWIDNQYAVASPEKGFGFGVLATGAGAVPRIGSGAD